MTVNIYDGFNVLLRDTNKLMHGRMSLRQRYEFIRRSNEMNIFVWDGAKHNERRREIYPRYKMQRTPIAEDVFSQIKLFREILTHTHAHQVECAGWEADDVISTLARSFAHKGMNVEVQSNDLDYAQLQSHYLITINGITKSPCEARLIPIYKALVGDSADNIAGIPGFGDKAWEAMLPHVDDIEDFVRMKNQASLLALPFTPRVLNWLKLPENIETLNNMYKIVHFYHVDDFDINNGISRGTPNHEAALALFKRFML